MNYIRSFKSGEGVAFYLAAAVLLGLVGFITWMTYRPLPEEVVTELTKEAIKLAKTPEDLKAIPFMFRPEMPDFKTMAAQLGPILALFGSLISFNGQQKRHKENMQQVK